jgi:predicted kinase
MVVIVFGLPGSGKSYFASRLAAKMNAGYINSDQVRAEVVHTKTYTEKEKLSVYAEMQARMKEALRQGKNVVLDATFYKNDIRQQFIKAAKPYDIFFMEVIADEAVSRKRLEKKRPDSDADIEVYKKIKQQWEPLNNFHLILQSTSENIEEMISKATEYLFINNDSQTN